MSVVVSSQATLINQPYLMNTASHDKLIEYLFTAKRGRGDGDYDAYEF